MLKQFAAVLFQLTSLFQLSFDFFTETTISIENTVRPRDTRPQAARTLQVHVFELGPKIFELNEFM